MHWACTVHGAARDSVSPSVPVPAWLPSLSLSNKDIKGAYLKIDLPPSLTGLLSGLDRAASWGRWTPGSTRSRGPLGSWPEGTIAGRVTSIAVWAQGHMRVKVVAQCLPRGRARSRSAALWLLCAGRWGARTRCAFPAPPSFGGSSVGAPRSPAESPADGVFHVSYTPLPPDACDSASLLCSAAGTAGSPERISQLI